MRLRKGFTRTPKFFGVSEKNERGFTLIELLIVIAIIAILASVVFVALDPLKRFQDARNSSRFTDVTSIVTAAKLDQVDNGGAYISTIAGLTALETYMITDMNPPYVSTTCNANCTAAVTSPLHCVDLDDTGAGEGLVFEGYLGKLPVSPNAPGNSWSANYTGYHITLNANNSITVGACDAEGTTISVTQ